MPVSISGDGAITGLELEAFEDVDVGSGAADGDVLTYDASGDLWIPQEIVLPAGVGSNVVQTVKTDAFSTSSLAVVTGLTATITPTSASSKVLVISQITVSNGVGSSDKIEMRRDGTKIFNATDGNTAQVTLSTNLANGLGSRNPITVSSVFLDSPGSTSPITYDYRVGPTGGTLFVNRAYNTGSLGGGVSSITLIEVAA